MIDIQTLDVLRDNSQELRHHAVKFHYLHRWPVATSLPFGYALMINSERYAPDGRLWGFVVMKKPQHLRQKDLFGVPGQPTAWQVLDLARVWIHPSLQGESATEFFTNRAGQRAPRNLNVFSQMVSKVIKRVQWDWLEVHPPRFPELPYHILVIISYCQLDHHDGIGYRASGFQSIGLSADKAKEVYVRRLKMPQKSWKPTGRQLDLFSEVK